MPCCFDYVTEKLFGSGELVLFLLLLTSILKLTAFLLERSCHSHIKRSFVGFNLMSANLALITIVTHSCFQTLLCTSTKFLVILKKHPSLEVFGSSLATAPILSLIPMQGTYPLSPLGVTRMVTVCALDHICRHGTKIYCWSVLRCYLSEINRTRI